MLSQLVQNGVQALDQWRANVCIHWASVGTVRQSRVKQDIKPMLAQYWPSVYDVGPILSQHWFNICVSCEARRAPACTQNWWPPSVANCCCGDRTYHESVHAWSPWGLYSGAYLHEPESQGTCRRRPLRFWTAPSSFTGFVATSDMQISYADLVLPSQSFHRVVDLPDGCLYFLAIPYYPLDKRRWPNDGLMLDQHRRWWSTNVKPLLVCILKLYSDALSCPAEDWSRFLNMRKVTKYVCGCSYVHVSSVTSVSYHVDAACPANGLWNWTLHCQWTVGTLLMTLDWHQLIFTQTMTSESNTIHVCTHIWSSIEVLGIMAM